jgi:type IV secretory pathway VirD2 relaxase
MREDKFTPRLGKMRAQGGKRTRRYLGLVAASVALAGKSGRAKSGFDGSRIGRGASMGRIMSGRHHARRVVVKTRLVRLHGKGLGAARAHLKYIQRDGVTREGAPGALYDKATDRADGQEFIERGAGDRHQFRFIVSPEDGDQYDDLKPFVRKLMGQAESDLGTRLDWVAVDHFNTGHPHTHIMLRGKDDRDADLIIAREYISNGLRERASELVTLDLGPRTPLEIEVRLRHDIGAERLTAIDRKLLREMDADRSVSAADRNPFQQSVRAGRLQTLGRMGLAEHVGDGSWQLSEGFEDALRRMGERGDIIRTMQRELSARKLDRPGVEQIMFDPSHGEPVTGRVIMRGLSDELHDRHFLLMDGTDGRVHHVDIGRGDATEALPEGAIVTVVPRGTGSRAADRTVANIAALNGGRYSAELHHREDPDASDEFVARYVRRLEALRRATGTVDRDPDGNWSIAPDHLDRAAAYERRQARDRPVAVEVVSIVPLNELAGAHAATWLDRELASSNPSPVRDAGFGKEVRGALAARRQWLIEEGLAQAEGIGVKVRADALPVLQRRDLLRAAGQLSGAFGVPFVEPQSGERIDGILTRRIDLASGRFALVQKSQEFTLVPWRPVLERQVGKSVSGIVRGDTVSWQFGRGRSGPQIS